VRKQEGRQNYVYVPATQRQLIAYAKKLQSAERLSWEAAFKLAQQHERTRAEAYARNIFIPQDVKALDALTKNEEGNR
jgi:hypothetical protein